MVSRCLEFHMENEPAEPSYGAAAAAASSAINNSMPMSLTVNVGAPAAIAYPAFPVLPPPQLPPPPPPVVHVQKSCVSSNTNRAWKLLSENTEEETKQEEMKLQKKVRTSASASLQAAAAAIRAAKNLHKIEGELTKEAPLSQAVGERTKKRGTSADAAQAKKKAAKTLAPQAALQKEDKEDKEESSKPLVLAPTADTPGGESSLACLQDSSLRASGSSVNGSAGSASGSLVIGDGDASGSLVNGDGNASGSLVNGDGNVSVSLGADPHSTPPRSSTAQAPLENNLLTGEKQKADTSQQGDCQDADFQSQLFSDMLFEDGPESPSEHHGAQPPRDTLAGSAEADEEAAAVEAAEAAEADEADEAAEELNPEVKEEVADEGEEAARKKARAKKGTVGTFAGRRPPKNEQKLREFIALRDHYKEVLKQLKEDNKMKAKPRFKSPCQNKYCAFMSSKMAELAKAGVSGGLRMKQAAQAWKKQQAAELGLDGA